MLGTIAMVACASGGTNPVQLSLEIDWHDCPEFFLPVPRFRPRLVIARTIGPIGDEWTERRGRFTPDKFWPRYDRGEFK